MNADGKAVGADNGAAAPVSAEPRPLPSPRGESRAERPSRNQERGERAARGERTRDERIDPLDRAESGTDAASSLGDATGAPEQREKRSRDRYGRERGPRNARPESGTRVESLTPDTAPVPEQATGQPTRKSYFAVEPAVPMDAPPEQAHAAAVAAVEPTAVAALPAVSPIDQVDRAQEHASSQATAKSAAMPKVQAFVLPLDELAQVAANSGLNWVNSDAEKIAAVHAAIAAEPSPIHVPRERPAALPCDDGPLILVETKRDLGAVTLPFETQP